MVTINCFWLGHSPQNEFKNLLTDSKNLFKYRINDFFKHLCAYDGYKVTNSRDSLQLQLRIDKVDIIIKILNKQQNYETAAVCLIAFPITNNRYVKVVKSWATDFNKICPTSPIILAGFATEANTKPALLRRAIIAGNEEITRDTGNKLAREIGAVKYVECSSITGKGAKILVDEIAFAGLGKLKAEKDNDHSKCAFQ